MKEARICPQCGARQQWEMWRTCNCGYNFGPPDPQSPKIVEEKPSKERYRTFRLRFWAGIIDALVFLPFNILDGFLMSPERGVFIQLAWAPLGFSAFWFYSVLLHARCGQTLGKMAMGVTVLDLSEKRIPTLKQSFIRDSGYIAINSLALLYFIYLVVSSQYVGDAEIATLPATILRWATLGWFLLEIITMLMNHKRRAIHDFLTDTVVVSAQDLNSYSAPTAI